MTVILYDGIGGEWNEDGTPTDKSLNQEPLVLKERELEELAEKEAIPVPDFMLSEEEKELLLKGEWFPEEDHVHDLAQGFSIRDMEKYVRCRICDRKWSKPEVERLLTAVDRIQERVERVLEGEDWNILSYILEVIGGDR